MSKSLSPASLTPVIKIGIMELVFFLLYFVDILFGWYNVTTFLEKFVFAKRSLNIFILILNKRPFFIFYVPLPYITNLIDSCPNS